MNEKGEQIPVKISDLRHHIVFFSLRHTMQAGGDSAERLFIKPPSYWGTALSG